MKYALVILLFSNIVLAGNLPKTVEELKKTSVRIMNPEMSSGGTGAIFRSYENASHILTNKHVCRLIEQGGVVDYNKKQYLITHYKKFEQHDLCIVRIATNLNINLKVAESLAKVSSISVVSGHPSLLPHIVTVGHLSEREDIDLITGIKPCTKQDLEENALECLFFGGKPLIKTLDSQLISNLIKPGNSGSSVFNENGEIIGVVFAGAGRDFSYGYIVPQLYVLFFVQNAHRYDFVKVGTPVDDEGVSDRVFNFDKCKEIEFNPNKKYKKIKDFCKNIRDNLIWRK